MKKNKHKEELQEILESCFAKHYHNMMSERIRRALARKKLSPSNL
jgi:hypothetical protein